MDIPPSHGKGGANYLTKDKGYYNNRQNDIHDMQRYLHAGHVSGVKTKESHYLSLNLESTWLPFYCFSILKVLVASKELQLLRCHSYLQSVLFCIHIHIGILDIGISALNSKHQYRYFCRRHYQFCIMYNNLIQHILNF